MSEQPPKWREDFPFETQEDEHITRRDAARFLLVVSGGFVVGNGVLLARADEAQDPGPEASICPSGELAPGSSRTFAYPDKDSPALLVRRLDGTLVAFDQRCTHLACPVLYAKGPEGESLECHCHRGRFDLASGQGTEGPPRELRPLRRIEVAERKGQIVALRFALRKEV